MRLTARTGAAGGLVALAPALAIASAGDLPEWARGIVGLLALALLPGAAILTRLPLRSPLETVAFAIAISLAIDTALALVLVWTRWWHPGPVMAVVLGVSTVVLAVDAIREARR